MAYVYGQSLSRSLCGCWFVAPSSHTKRYLPQVDLKAHTTIQSTASRTKLTQTFRNDDTSSETTPEIKYTFPLYDGVSVVSFRCTIGKKVILGVVKERNTAKAEYDQAVARGEVAGLLEQLTEASDVFSSSIGNVPKGETAIVEIEYVGELKHDAQLDGIRFMIPTEIAPRYGNVVSDSQSKAAEARGGTIAITVDVEVDEGSHIEGLSSPSHPIAMTMGKTSRQTDVFKSNRASATLALDSVALDGDFVIIVNSQNQGIPKALLETHPDYPRHRAIMATLVPQFNLPNIHPEVVFVVDRSGSMDGKMATVIQALKVFLKSLPLSSKFNICSFGSSHTFMFDKSRSYDERSLQQGLKEVEGFHANYGGTELLAAVEETVKRRWASVPLEVMVLTDGDIWNQHAAFEFVNNAAKENVRLFSLGIGAGASSSLVEGLARAGNGFAQFVQDNEKMDKRVVRMLKAALTPHITDYQLKIEYENVDTPTVSSDDFEVIDAPSANKSTLTKAETPPPQPISLFDPNFKEAPPNPPVGRYDHLPTIDPPQELQAPSSITGLFPHNRVTSYLLLPDSTRKIKSVILQGTYEKTPVQLKIPIQRIGRGRTVHQLAAKRAMLDTEEGRGWLASSSGADGASLKTKYASDWDRIVEREAVRLGVKFQVAGKFCSFVAVEDTKSLTSRKKVVSTTHPEVVYYGGTEECREQDYDDEDCEEDDDDMGFGLFDDYGSGAVTVAAAAAAMAPPPAPAPTPSAVMSQSSLFGLRQASGVQFCMAPSSKVHFKRRGSPPAAFGAAAPPGASAPYASFGAPAPAAAARPSSNSTSFTGVTLSSVRSPNANPGAGMGAQMGSTKQQQPSLFGAAPPPPPATVAASRGGGGFGAGGTGIFARLAQDRSARRRSSPPAQDAPAPASPMRPIPKDLEGKIHLLIELQNFNGSWTIMNELFALTGVSKGDFTDKLIDLDESARATVIAIAWFEKRAAKENEVWEMVVDKAKEWLRRECGIKDVDGAVGQAVASFFA